MTDTTAIIREVRDCVACWLENATEDHLTPDAVRGWTMSADDFDSIADALGLPRYLAAWEDTDIGTMEDAWREAIHEAADALDDGASPDSVALALRAFD